MSEQETVEKRVLMCVSRSMVSMNTGERGLHFYPTQRVEMSPEEVAHPQVQKLLKAKFLVDVTAAEERRNARAK